MYESKEVIQVVELDGSLQCSLLKKVHRGGELSGTYLSIIA